MGGVINSVGGKGFLRSKHILKKDVHNSSKITLSYRITPFSLPLESIKGFEGRE
jgi:hypothetical protein